MAVKTWQTMKVKYCVHAKDDVNLEAEVIYPAENLPDLMARIYAHRCSHAMVCNTPNCVWAGTNPLVDPFKDKE